MKIEIRTSIKVSFEIPRSDKAFDDSLAQSPLFTLFTQDNVTAVTSAERYISKKSLCGPRES